MRKPSFMGHFTRHVKVGEWVTGRQLAARVHPAMDGADLSEVAKDFSRRLSNLERYGHIQRRLERADNGSLVFVYTHRETMTLRPWKSPKASWFPT